MRKSSHDQKLSIRTHAIKDCNFLIRLTVDYHYYQSLYPSYYLSELSAHLTSLCYRCYVSLWAYHDSNFIHHKKTIVTGPPNGPVLFCWLASVVVVCNAAGVRAGRAGGPSAHRRPVHINIIHFYLTILFTFSDLLTAFCRFVLK